MVNSYIRNQEMVNLYSIYVEGWYDRYIHIWIYKQQMVILDTSPELNKGPEYCRLYIAYIASIKRFARCSAETTRRKFLFKRFCQMLLIKAPWQNGQLHPFTSSWSIAKNLLETLCRVTSKWRVWENVCVDVCNSICIYIYNTMWRGELHLNPKHFTHAHVLYMYVHVCACVSHI